MKKNQIIVALLCMFVVIFAVSCKDEIVENITNVETQLAGDNYRGIDIVDNPEFGTMLKFRSVDQVKNLSDKYLDTLSNEQLLKWSENIDKKFTSQLQYLSKNMENEQRFSFGGPSLDAVVNKSGYVMVGDNIYHYFDRIGSYELIDSKGKVEIVDFGDEIQKVSSEQQSRLMGPSCKIFQTQNGSFEKYNCPSYGNKEYTITGFTKYYSSWGTHKLVLETRCFRQPCGSGQANSYSAAKIGLEVNYDLIIDGVTSVGSQNLTINNAHTYSKVLASGSYICVHSVSTKHKVYPTLSPSTYLEVDTNILP